jgi:PQQ-like domain
MTVRIIKITLYTLVFAALAYAEAIDSLSALKLDFGDTEDTSEPERLTVGPGGEIFILDRTLAVLARVCPETGKPLWRIDGSESGRTFLDPSYLSHADGFFIYLTDRGSRLIWRIDYRGEVRGSIDLSFADDPLLLELVAGNQMAVYDRATAEVHLLDDSGRRLWSFAAGTGRRSGEPQDIAVSADGSRLYILWSGGGGVTAVDIFGRAAHELGFRVESFTPRRIATVAMSDRNEWLCLTDRRQRLVLLETTTGAVQEAAPVPSPVWDISASDGKPGVIYLLAGSPPALVEIDLERVK